MTCSKNACSLPHDALDAKAEGVKPLDEEMIRLFSSFVLFY